MNEATTQAILSVLRSILIIVGSWLTSRGYLSDGTVEQLIGAIIVLAPVLWGVLQKYTSERKTKAREVVAVNVGVGVANSTPVGIDVAPIPAKMVPGLIKDMTL